MVHWAHNTHSKTFIHKWNERILYTYNVYWIRRQYNSILNDKFLLFFSSFSFSSSEWNSAQCYRILKLGSFRICTYSINHFRFNQRRSTLNENRDCKYLPFLLSHIYCATFGFPLIHLFTILLSIQLLPFASFILYKYT